MEPVSPPGPDAERNPQTRKVVPMKAKTTSHNVRLSAFLYPRIRFSTAPSTQFPTPTSSPYWLVPWMLSHCDNRRNPIYFRDCPRGPWRSHADVVIRQGEIASTAAC